MNMIEINDLYFAYNGHKALEGVSFSAAPSVIFGFLGPNGSGKTTLFRILSTLLTPAQGTVQICGMDLSRESSRIREKIGVVFQSPSVDPHLTVIENLEHQGRLYGLRGAALKQRIHEMLERLGLAARAREIVSKLSGGLKRRVELAKGLLHRPKVLILDEPSTGLDPGARIDLWNYLTNLRDREGMCILVTTHLMEEAECCDDLVILNHGKVVAKGHPRALKKEAGRDVVLVQGKNLEDLRAKIGQRFELKAVLSEEILQIEDDRAPALMTKIAAAFPEEIQSITFRKPTLEDVFLHKTGHHFWSKEPA